MSSTFILQLHCCGVDNATDWITLNPTALADNMGNSTAGCGCKSGSNNCVQVNGTAAVNMTNKMFSFYAWEDVCPLYYMIIMKYAVDNSDK